MKALPKGKMFCVFIYTPWKRKRYGGTMLWMW